MTVILDIAVLATLIPAAVLMLRGPARRGALFWWLTAAATVGPCVWTWAQLDEGWNTSLAVALWLIIAFTMILFVIVAAITREGWRLGALLLPFLILLAALATIWEAAPEQPFIGTAPAGWLRVHIVVSLAAYGLLTLAAVAALAVFLQERALKAKRRPPLSGTLPSVADGALLQVRLLIASAIVLAAGLLTGMAIEHYEIGELLRFNHKTVLSFLTFFVILALLYAHSRTGVRGKRAAQLVLLAYLLLVLAFPGVKFVHDVLLGR